MVSSPVLALPNFTKNFVVEIDASGGKIGAILIQDSHSIAYLSRALSLNAKHCPYMKNNFWQWY